MKCEHCGKEHNRNRFCSNKCKDRWHNKHNPRGIAALAMSDDGSEIAEIAGDDYAAGWDEDGWRDDYSGVSAS